MQNMENVIRILTQTKLGRIYQGTKPKPVIEVKLTTSISDSRYL